MTKTIHSYCLSCLLLLIGLPALYGQQATITLNKKIDSSAIYVARDNIRALEGFSFNPNPGNKTLYLGIDEHLLVPTVYQTRQQIPNPNRSLNTNYAVGSIAGEASVNPTGAALYQIAIDVMPGTGGIQPNISIVYNSQSGNGVVGYGWSLSAISAITRTGSTLYHDNTIRVPDLTTSDNVTLDGQRLMLATGFNLSTSSTYKTEIESYQTITYKSQNGYPSFEVVNKEGWTLQYGSSTDSYIQTAGSATPYAWLLKKVTDANGNYMTYTYENSIATGEYRLKQIDYTGNTAAGLSPYNKVEFFYEIRKDSTTHFITNEYTQIQQRVLLKRIKCSTEGSAVREYKFNYFYDEFLSKLTEVEVYGQDGIRYNSTVVDWGDYSSENAKTGGEYTISTSKNINNHILVYADFNRDGKTDILFYPENVSSSSVATLFLATDDPSNLGNIQFVEQCTILLGSNFTRLTVADVNGDGLMDVVHTQRSAPYTYRYTYYMYDGTSFTPNHTHAFEFFSELSDIIPGDFNGDGKDEILIKTSGKADRLYDQDGNYKEILGMNWGSKYYNPIYPSSSSSKRASPRKIVDFNGNGKMDLLILDGTELKAYEFNGTSFSFQSSSPSLRVSPKFDFLVGDFNGDGKTDILVRESNPDEYFLLLSTGTSFIKKSLPDLGITGYWSAADFNRDGKTDVAYGFPNGIVKIGLYNGGKFDNFTPHQSSIMIGTDLSTSWEDSCFSDFDGDGYPEMCHDWLSYSFVIKSFTSQQNVLVKTVINGLNHKSSFTYHPITNNNYYQRSSLPVLFPVSHFQQPLFVVSSWRQHLGNLSDTLSYFYKGAKIHRQGKGFLGFEEVTATNKLQNRKATTRYTFNPSFFNVYPTKQTVTTIAGDSISRTSYQHDCFSTSVPKVIFPFLLKQTTVDKLTGLSSTVDYAYNLANHGNPSMVTQTQDNLIIKTLYTWEAKGGSLYKNRLTQQITTQQGIGTSFSQNQIFAYDANARLTQQVDFYGDYNAVTTAYSNYDYFGNPLTVTTTALNCPTITTSSVYDATGRFATNQTDALGNTSYAQHDTKTGVLLNQTDIAGLTTTYLYNGFQQLVQTQTPFETLTYATSWNISGNNLYRTSAASSISGTQYIWYSAAGQELKTQSQGFSGTVVTENTYNAKGQLYRSYLPEYTNSSQQYIEYAYDPYGRLHSETNIGRTTTYAYNGLTTTVTAPTGKTRSTTLNATGWVASATDEAGVPVTYTYNSLGKPVTITAAGDVTQITYDNRGFQYSLKDVNMASSIISVYDAYGQLQTHVNERGQYTTYQYDVAGRITQQTAPERTLTYQYVPYGVGIGHIQTIQENNNTVRAYTYTPLGQVQSITEKIDGVDYITNYAYQANGLLQQRGSPSGMNVTYQYTYGMLASMRHADNNALLWQANTINALGQIAVSTLGNGLQRVSGYDTYHLPNKIELKDGVSVIDQIDYGFNPVSGNLYSRNDISNSRSEFFGYDALNRLDTLRLNYGVLNRTTYHNNGNINTKYNVGTYQYANNSHKVTGISNPVSGYTYPDYTLTNTSYHRPLSLTLQGTPTKKLDFQYNADNQRRKTLYSENNALVKTMYYVGNYEKEVIEGGDTNEYDYIYSPEGLAAIAVKTNNARSLYYAHVDHLGSLRVVTTPAKAIQTRYHYDAWGWRTLVAGTGITNRGFTGHEHLPEFGFINANARLYDPVLGRFLSFDPYVVDDTYTQDYNRYTYALNNPLIFTDPTGEYLLWDDLIAAAIGGIINVVVNAIQGNIHSWGEGFSYFGIGAAGTWAGLYAGPAVSGMIIGGGNSFISQGFAGSSGGWGNWNWKNISGLQVAFDGIMGGLTSQLGAGLNKMISPYVSKLTSGIGGQAFQQAANQSISGSAVGFSMNAGLAWMQGASFEEGLKAGGTGALMGFGIGFSTGLITGTRAAYKAGESPWSGRHRALTNDELVYNAGAKAAEAVEGTGRYAGTDKHTYAEDLINRYQDIYGDRGLRTEYPFKDVGYGAGRLDVYSPKTNTIYDYKFGYPNQTVPQLMNTPQINKYQNSFPGFRTVIFKY